MKKARRDTSACQSDTAEPPTTTAPPRPSCNVQDTSPGLGITSQGCICDGSSTWKALSTSLGATYGAQCAYTAPPSNTAQATITESQMQPQTNSQACIVCTPQYNFEDECTSMPDCNPQTAYATATVNSSPIHYGTLSQDALYTGIIPYTDADVLREDGILSINVGSYAATTDQLNALLAVAASMVTKSANSSDKSCHIMGYVKPEIKPRGLLRRAISAGLSPLVARDHPVPEPGHMRVCNGPAVVVASYWAPGYRTRIGGGNQSPSPDAQFTATIKFTTGADGDFFCELASALAGEILTEVAPELGELDILTAEQIEAACEQMNE
ncbi:hypothetical protein K491DRAFT_671348 [Lophiostoma macrostomum CBS 122681]|uniref:Uncharacterized protein n=1 Tax=Lophiostoma macrostomum CBS 122681 TaxID=1314788 RepID=A0A6A6SKR0_9PLEO|nr:hypothetical protein K491DRAFT_671348 [Lophiostoma macrostomum CBS 122681]